MYIYRMKNASVQLFPIEEAQRSCEEKIGVVTSPDPFPICTKQPP